MLEKYMPCSFLYILAKNRNFQKKDLTNIAKNVAQPLDVYIFKEVRS
jgi:hypothetical protein